ncbi:hypothetical protein CAP39_12800 [Sphingomonas sp. IBVSS1]|uniref:Uncharacterized protein n=1 Tax=Sandarakinorhabdus cyanobacteriorum TaxID=1981098 RepID=A0A255Y622_9SPHN|nr:hypothetical protein [Sandarakinorhabdus cyanobacteriorum]OSZ65342.1 hypothetical protein CAP39_12800 [Sphingomonas sp. IBVSS1]OYQ24666.1 hypothetical protein CHU93_14975 [Sandarakinorhabdus cyanobacteriorum]
MSLLPVVEKYLRANHVPPSRFGRLVAGDPRFVFDLRRGREPRAATRARVLAHITGETAAAGREVAHATAR